MAVVITHADRVASSPGTAIRLTHLFRISIIPPRNGNFSVGTPIDEACSNQSSRRRKR